MRQSCQTGPLLVSQCTTGYTGASPWANRVKASSLSRRNSEGNLIPTWTFVMGC